MSRHFAKVLGVLAVLLSLSISGYPQEKSEPSTVRLSWEEFKKLLELDKDEIVLSWSEFQRLIAQTGSTFVPVFELKDEKVVLSRSQFRNLLERMKPFVGTPVHRPADWLPRKSSYRARLSGGAVLVRAEIAVEVFPPTPGAYVNIPLFPGSVALRDVWLNDAPALVQIADGRYAVATNKAGALRITAEIALRASGDQVQAVSFPVPRSPITTLDFDLPFASLDVEVSGAQQVEVFEKGGATRVSAVLSPTEVVSLKWRKKIVEAAPGPAKVYADTVTLISVEDDALRVSAEIALSILQNTIPAIVLRVPDGYGILEVRGVGVGDWREIRKNEAVYLEVPFDFPKKGNFSLVVTAEKLLPGASQAVDYAGFSVVDAVREKGFLGVELKGAAEVVLSSAKGADSLDVSELPAGLIGRSAKPLIFGLKYLRPPFALVLEVKKREAVPVISTVIDTAGGVTLFTEDGKLVHRVVYSVRNTSKQFLEVALPDKAELWSVFVAGEPAKPRWGEGRVLIPLNRSREGASGLAAFEVEIVYYEKAVRFGGLGRRGTRFPVPDVIVSQALWSVYLPEGYEYLHFGGSVEKERMASGLRPLLGFKRRTVSPAAAVAGRPGEEAPAVDKDLILREADAMKKEFSANLALDAAQLAAQAENEFRFNQRVQDIQTGKIAVANGILPLRVQIPTSGELYRFAKTLVSGEALTLTLAFMSRGLRTGVIVSVLAGLALALFVVFKRRPKGTGHGPGLGRAARKMGMLFLASAVLLWIFSRGMAAGSLVVALLALALSRLESFLELFKPRRAKALSPAGKDHVTDGQEGDGNLAGQA
jgi:hypothetical protein